MNVAQRKWQRQEVSWLLQPTLPKEMKQTLIIKADRSVLFGGKTHFPHFIFLKMKLKHTPLSTSITRTSFSHHFFYLQQTLIPAQSFHSFHQGMDVQMSQHHHIYGQHLNKVSLTTFLKQALDCGKWGGQPGLWSQRCIDWWDLWRVRTPSDKVTWWSIH